MSSLLLTTAWFSFSLQIFPILSDTPDPNCFFSPLILLSKLLLQTASNHCPHFLPWLPETSYSPFSQLLPQITFDFTFNCCHHPFILPYAHCCLIPLSFLTPTAAWSLGPFLPQLLSDPFVLSYPNCCLIPLSFLTLTAAWSLCPFLPQLLPDPFVLFCPICCLTTMSSSQLLSIPLVLIYPNCCPIPVLLHPHCRLMPQSPVFLHPHCCLTPCSLTSPLLPNILVCFHPNCYLFPLFSIPSSYYILAAA